ncbi:hypothetical protein DFJ43DRAFT_113906 [Lentinula guzmanii]|uniref:Uncharacterized protein n=1 Tax=Lentinula guzmanii TaxID=2804957 RepID=A0AA38J1S8_9AGAR|nr:hypothetical protein DFJ43DRAFT_113906 [Lentinula guzmanii]
MSEYLNDGRLSGQISTEDNHIGGQNQNDPHTNFIDSQKQEHSSDNQVYNGENTIDPNVYEQRNVGNQDQNGPANDQGVHHKSSAPDNNASNPSAQEVGTERPISLTENDVDSSRRPIERRQGSPEDTRSEIKVAHNVSSAHVESQNDETRENVTADLGVDQQSSDQAQERHEIQKPGAAKILDEAVTRDVSSSVPFRGLNNQRSGLDVVSDTTDGSRSPSIVESRKYPQGISSDIQMDGIHRDGSNGVMNVDEQRPSPTQEHDSNLGDQGAELDSQVQIKNQGNHSRPTNEIRESVPPAQADIKETAIVSNPKTRKDQNVDGTQNVEHNRNSDENAERYHSTCDRTGDVQKPEERESLPSQRTATEHHGANSLSSQEAVSNERSLDTHDMSNVASGGPERSESGSRIEAGTRIDTRPTRVRIRKD